MIFFVQGHRVVPAQSFKGPLRYRPALTVDGLHYVPGVGNIHEDVSARRFHLERFGMTFCLVNVVGTFVGLRIAHCDSAVVLPESNKNHLGSLVIPHVVGIFAKVESLAKRVVCAFIHSNFPVFRVCNVELVNPWDIEWPLRLGQSPDAVNHPSGEDIDHFHGVVAER